MTETIEMTEEIEKKEEEIEKKEEEIVEGKEVDMLRQDTQDSSLT